MPAPTITVWARVGRSATAEMMTERVARATPMLRHQQLADARAGAATRFETADAEGAGAEGARPSPPLVRQLALGSQDWTVSWFASIQVCAASSGSVPSWIAKATSFWSSAVQLKF